MASFSDKESSNPIIRRAEEQYKQGYNGPGFASVNHPTNGQQAGAGTPLMGNGAGGANGAVAGPQPPTTPSGADAATLNEMYNAPAVAGASGVPMTIHDVIMKTLLNFGILFVGALVGWTTATSMPYLWIGAMIVGLVLGLTNAFKKSVSPILIMAYSIVQGVFLGGISSWFQAYGESQGWGNLVLTAVVATLIVFAVMLTLYTTRIIKVTGRFKKVMMIAMISYLFFALASFVSALFGVGNGWGFFGAGPIGIIFSVVVVCIAAFTLLLDFDAIEAGIKYGVPERESWRMAFGLMVTMIWLYLEILRLLALVAGRN